MNKEVEFWNHAKRQLRERNLDEELVRDALKSPGQIVKGQKNRKIAQKIYKRGGQRFPTDSPQKLTFFEKVSFFSHKYWRQENEDKLR